MKIAHKYLIVVCFLSTISSLPLVAAPSVNIGYRPYTYPEPQAMDLVA